MIKIDNTEQKELYSGIYPMCPVDRGNYKLPLEKRWCGVKSKDLSIRCSREIGHTGPHRYQAMSLWLWFDEGYEAEEQILEVCIRLGVVPTGDSK